MGFMLRLGAGTGAADTQAAGGVEWRRKKKGDNREEWWNILEFTSNKAIHLTLNILRV